MTRSSTGEGGSGKSACDTLQRLMPRTTAVQGLDPWTGEPDPYAGKRWS